MGRGAVDVIFMMSQFRKEMPYCDLEQAWDAVPLDTPYKCLREGEITMENCQTHKDSIYETENSCEKIRRHY